MHFFKTVLVSALAALATAHTDPDYSQSPKGNAISNPGLNEIVPVGKPYEIKWNPTTEGPISLVLLRGPSENVQPLKTLAETVDNTGHFTWTPAADLEPDTTHYGLLLVVEGTGQYQWSTQFGISNPDYQKHSSSSAVASSTPEPTVTSTSTKEETATDCPTTTTTTSTAVSSPAAAKTTSAAQTTASSSAVVSPSKTPSAQTTLRSSSVPSQSPTPSGPSTPIFSGAADRNAISFGAVAAGVAAVLAF